MFDIKTYRSALGRDLCRAEHEMLELEKRLAEKKVEVEQYRGALAAVELIVSEQSKNEPSKNPNS